VENNKRRIAILGSTGSIGQQTLDVIKQHNDQFQLVVLLANNNADLLIQQAIEHKPEFVIINNKEKFQYTNEILFKYNIKVFAGTDSFLQLLSITNIDLVIAAMVGYAGLQPVIWTIEHSIPVALANKETLVVAGDYITSIATKYNTPILPVDSEHSAIFQCLIGEKYNSIEKIYLTASGGPFRGKTNTDLLKVTKHDALKHPNWSMGNKITIDSATLINKGFEVIEAKWLFNLNPEQIDVIIHPQSIIHSIVQFIDGSMKAQMSLPDMKIAIQYALSYPIRMQNNLERLDLLKHNTLSFMTVDHKTFPCLALAYETLKKAGNAPCILNAANEIAVNAFLNDKIRFIDIPSIIEKSINKISYIKYPTLNDYIITDKETRIFANSLIN